MTEHSKGYRLTRIYTRTGDRGQTRTGDGRKLSKCHARIEAIGTIDEVNSWTGMLLLSLEHELEPELLAQIQNIQHRLFDLGGELAAPDCQLITDKHTAGIEALIDQLNASLPPLENFILPGGGQAACHAHVARTLTRRAERKIVALLESGEPVSTSAMAYINRLSDLFFVLGRFCARQNAGEVLWLPSEIKSR